MAKINLIAGQNNSGKSNVLRVARNLKHFYSNGVEGYDIPRVASPDFTLAMRIGDLADVVEKMTAQDTRSQRTLPGLLAHESFDLFNDGGVFDKIYRPQS